MERFIHLRQMVCVDEILGSNRVRCILDKFEEFWLQEYDLTDNSLLYSTPVLQPSLMLIFHSFRTLVAATLKPRILRQRTEEITHEGALVEIINRRREGKEDRTMRIWIPQPSEGGHESYGEYRLKCRFSITLINLSLCELTRYSDKKKERPSIDGRNVFIKEAVLRKEFGDKTIWEGDIKLKFNNREAARRTHDHINARLAARSKK